MSINTASELMTGEDEETAGDRWILHIRNNGMNSMRESDMARRLFADHIRRWGNAQTYRPKKSPMLNMRKCIALKKSG